MTTASQMVLNGPRVPLRPLAELCFSLQPDAHSANTVSDDLVEILKKALVFPSKMDCDEVITSQCFFRVSRFDAQWSELVLMCFLDHSIDPKWIVMKSL